MLLHLVVVAGPLFKVIPRCACGITVRVLLDSICEKTAWDLLYHRVCGDRQRMKFNEVRWTLVRYGHWLCCGQRSENIHSQTFSPRDYNIALQRKFSRKSSNDETIFFYFIVYVSRRIYANIDKTEIPNHKTHLTRPHQLDFTATSLSSNSALSFSSLSSSSATSPLLSLLSLSAFSYTASCSSR